MRWARVVVATGQLLLLLSVTGCVTQTVSKGDAHLTRSLPACMDLTHDEQEAERLFEAGKCTREVTAVD